MIQVVFENSEFIICDKPALVLSTPDRHHSDRPCLGLELQKKIKSQIFPVHRLDFEVSGLVMYAKNEKAHRASQDWFLKKEISKKYLALSGPQDFSHWPEKVKTDRSVLTPQAGKEFSWKTKILRGKRRSFESEQGEWAETRAIVEQVEQIISAPQGRKKITWHLYPLTGKPHQLRLEMSRHGFVIWGDSLYGSKKTLDKEIWPYGGIALRAVELDLTCVNNRLNLPEKIKL